MQRQGTAGPPSPALLVWETLLMQCYLICDLNGEYLLRTYFSTGEVFLVAKGLPSASVLTLTLLC